MSRGPWLTAAFKAEVWRHWQAGETCSEISRALYKTSGVIHGVVAERGGVAPVARCRSRRALTLLEREEISRGLCAGDSIRQMARRLGRAPSSLSREIARQAAETAIAHCKPMPRPGAMHNGPRCVDLPRFRGHLLYAARPGTS